MAWQAVSGRVRLRLVAFGPRMEAGRLLEEHGAGAGLRLEVVGRLREPRRAGEPAEVNVRSILRAERLEAGALGWWRTGVRRSLALGMEGTRAEILLRRLLLGDSDGRLQKLEDEFRSTGTAHLLAISGQHVALVAGFVYVLARVMGAGPRLTLAVMLIATLVYGLAATGSPPVWRAVLLAMLAGAAVWMAREVRPINLLAGVLVLMLAINPAAAAGAGFQLTFGCVAGLMLLAPRLMAWMKSLADVDELIADRWMPQTPRAKRRVYWNAYVVPMLASAAVAFAVSVPIAAWHFSAVSLYAIPATLVLTPIVTLALILAVVKAMVGVILPGAGAVMAAPAQGAAEAMAWGVELVAKLPEAVVYLPRPPLWLVAIYFAALAWAAWPQEVKPVAVKGSERLIRPGLAGGCVLRGAAVLGVMGVMLAWPSRVLTEASAVVAVDAAEPVVLVWDGGRWTTMRSLDGAAKAVAERRVRALGERLGEPDAAKIDGGRFGIVRAMVGGRKVVDLTATSSARLRQLLEEDPLELVGDVMVLHPRLEDEELISRLVEAGQPQLVVAGEAAEVPAEVLRGSYVESWDEAWELVEVGAEGVRAIRVK